MMILSKSRSFAEQKHDEQMKIWCVRTRKGFSKQVGTESEKVEKSGFPEIKENEKSKP
jgi:hypothetical protein